MEGYKTCSKCGDCKPLTDYHKNKKRLDGLYPQCKSCKLAADALYREANKTKILKQQREAYWANPERARNQKRLDYQKHREQRLKEQKEYRQANAEFISERNKDYKRRNAEKHLRQVSDWQRKNPERVKKAKARYKANNRVKLLADTQKRRARRNGNGVYAVSKKESDRLYASPCVACGTRHNITVDHIVPIARGGHHSIGNLQPLCGSCNSSKKDQLMIEWRVWRDKLAGPSVGAA